MLLVNYGWTYNADIPDGKVTVTGGSLGSDVYQLNNIHMHRISEHSIDGAHYPVEFHFVCLNVDVCPWYLNAAAGECDGYLYLYIYILY